MPSRACRTYHRLAAEKAHLHPVSFEANIGCIDAENSPPLGIRMPAVTVSDPF